MNRMLTLLHPLVFTALLTQTVAAQRTHQIIDGEKVSKPWAEVVGRKVVVQGLAWGALEKGLGQRVVLDGHNVYVRNVDFLKYSANGRLVRVMGTLRIGSVSKAKPGYPGFGEDFNYYYIDVTEWKIVDEVSSPWMEEVIDSKGAVDSES